MHLNVKTISLSSPAPFLPWQSLPFVVGRSYVHTLRTTVLLLDAQPSHSDLKDLRVEEKKQLCISIVSSILTLARLIPTACLETRAWRAGVKSTGLRLRSLSLSLSLSLPPPLSLSLSSPSCSLLLLPSFQTASRVRFIRSAGHTERYCELTLSQLSTVPAGAYNGKGKGPATTAGVAGPSASRADQLLADRRKQAKVGNDGKIAELIQARQGLQANLGELEHGFARVGHKTRAVDAVRLHKLGQRGTTLTGEVSAVQLAGCGLNARAYDPIAGRSWCATQPSYTHPLTHALFLNLYI